MYRMARNMSLAPAVRHSSTNARWLASGPRPGSAVLLLFLEWKLLLSGGSLHLIERNNGKWL